MKSLVSGQWQVVSGLNILKILIILGTLVQTIISCSSDSSGGEETPSSSSVEGTPSSSSEGTPSSSSVALSSSGGGSPSSSSEGGTQSSSSVVSGSVCSIDGYNTVTIGSQIWMAENLNCEVEGSRCYDNDPDNCEIYGRLYDWETAMTVCPSGWHLPSDAEWTILTNHAGSDSGTKLKATSGWDNGGDGTDEHDFAALPGGYGYGNPPNLTFSSIGGTGRWWTATADTEESTDGSLLVYRRSIRSDEEDVSRGNSHRLYLFSVRCVKDNP